MENHVSDLLSKIEDTQTRTKTITILFGELCPNHKNYTFKPKEFEFLKDSYYNTSLFSCFNTIIEINKLFEAHTDQPEERSYKYYEMLLPALRSYWLDRGQNWLYYELLKRIEQGKYQLLQEDKSRKQKMHAEVKIFTNDRFFDYCAFYHNEGQHGNIHSEINKVLRDRLSIVKAFERLIAANQEYLDYMGKKDSDPEDLFLKKCNKFKKDERSYFTDLCNELQRHTNGIFIYPLTTTKEEKVSILLNYILESDLFRSTEQHLYKFDIKRNYYVRLNKFREDEEAILKMFTPELQRYISSHVVKEVLFRLYRLPAIRVDEEFFNNDGGGRFVNCINGVFDLRSGILFNHNTSFLRDCNFNYCNNAEYIPKDERPKAKTFNKFIETSLGYKGAKTFLLEIIGNLCCPNIPYKNAFFFIGKPNTGKTQIGNLIKAIIGEESVSGIELHDLESRFSNSLLATARLNMHMEMSSKPLKNIAAFKTITGRDYAKGEFKGQPLFVFTHKCKLLFGGNIMPQPKDPETSEAFIERVTILLFPKSIPKEDVDIYLYDHLLGEKDIIYSRAMDKASDMYNQDIKTFNEHQPPKCRKYQDKYRADTTLIPQFIEECCDFTEDDSDFTSCKDVYNAFLKYDTKGIFNHSNNAPQHQGHFSRQFKKVAQINQEKVDGIQGYKGLRIIEKNDD